MKPIIKPIMKPKLTEYISSVCSASDAAALEQKLKTIYDACNAEDWLKCASAIKSIGKK